MNEKIKVLVADDNQEWCKALCDHIHSVGAFTVLPPVYSGDNVIHVIEATRPDIILLDLILPVYDGFYIVNYIQRELKDYRPFIYILSAIGTTKTNRIMHNLDVDYYSIKPIEADAVANNLLRLYSSVQGQQEGADKMGTEAPLERGKDADLLSINVPKQVDMYLHDLGSPLYRVSTVSLRLALRLSLENDTMLRNITELYKVITQQPEIKTRTVSAVERNLRSSIKLIHHTGNPYYQTCFPDHYQNKIPTNTVFLNHSIYLLQARIEDYLSD